MFNSWFNIKVLSKFLEQHLLEASLGKPFTYTKGEVHFPIVHCEKFEDLRFSILPPLPLISLVKTIPAPRKHVTVLSQVEGKIITNVLYHRSDRQMIIELNQGKGFLLFQAFGINGNVLLLNSDFEIQNSFKKRKTYNIPDEIEFQSEDSHIFNDEQLHQLLKQNENKTISGFLKSLPVPIFSVAVENEICFRVMLEPGDLVINLQSNQIEKLLKHIKELFLEFRDPQYILYESEPPVMSFLNLHSINTSPVFADDYQELVDQYLKAFFKWYSLTNKKNDLTKKLEKQKFYLQRRVIKQKNALKNFPTSNAYREYGDTILTNIYRISGRMSFIILPKLTDPKQEIRIPLNPKLSPAKNAEHYYRKSGNIKKSKENLTQSIRQTELEIKKIIDSQKQISNCFDIRKLRGIEKQLPQSVLQPNKSPEEIERWPYYRFLYKDWEILVGKSARDNDTLSFKKAKPNDFWLHAYKITGSHVIVRNPQKKETLPKSILERAAAIAAFYSKSKHSGLVSVACTKKKYVWKRKSMAPGAVFMKFEKTVIVQPFDPRD